MSASPTSNALTVGDAVGYGWARFKANPWTWVGAVVIAAVIQSVLNTLFGERSALRVDTFGQSFWTVNWIIGSILATVVGYLINAALVRGALDEVDGRRPALGAFFRFANVGNVILASIVVGVLTAIGIIILGAIALGLGLLVTIPLSIIASTYAYRVVSGGGVAP